jgi:putative Ca2+/H+ antiporter (TMEM165/GDT1 family)
MDYKLMFTTFVIIFMAELGDKTQLTTLVLAAEDRSKLTAVFIGSAGALVLSSLLAVLGGSFVHTLIPANYIRKGAGALFILLGLWMLLISA